jgi:type I restriction enzyme S subunit
MQISKFPDFQISNLPFEPASVLLERIKEERKKKLGSKYKEPRQKDGGQAPPLDTSELPDLPEGWTWTTTSEICNLINGRAFKPSEWSSRGIPIVRIQNLNDPQADFNYCDFQVEEKYQIDNGQLLFAWSGTPGTSFGAHIWNRGKAILNQHIFRVEVDERNLNKWYLMHLFNNNVDEYIRKAHGTAGLAHITKAKFETSAIPLPPLAEQQQIVSEIERRFSVADEVEKVVEQSLKQAERLRQSILKRAFEGKLVPQDPTDPPAIQLLEEIRKQKENAAATIRKGQRSLRRASQSASVSVERIKKEKEKQTAKNAKKHKE